MSHPPLYEVQSRARQYLTKQDILPTVTRVAVVAAVLRSEGWFDAEDLLTRGRNSCRRLSRATVYRLLPQLCRAGLLHASEFGDGHHRYRRADPGENPTAEILIVDCGKIVEQPAPFLSWYGQSIVGKAGLELESQRMQARARCAHKRSGGMCETCPHEAPSTSDSNPSHTQPSFSRSTP